jgi:hypothetical protein
LLACFNVVRRAVIGVDRAAAPRLGFAFDGWLDRDEGELAANLARLNDPAVRELLELFAINVIGQGFEPSLQLGGISGASEGFSCREARVGLGSELHVGGDLDVIDERVDHGIALDGVERAGKCGRREAAEQNAYDESCTRRRAGTEDRISYVGMTGARHDEGAGNEMPASSNTAPMRL